MGEIKLLELFGGIGACSKALERIGIDYELVDYVEIDKYAVAFAWFVWEKGYKGSPQVKWIN